MGSHLKPYNFLVIHNARILRPSQITGKTDSLTRGSRQIAYIDRFVVEDDSTDQRRYYWYSWRLGYDTNFCDPSLSSSIGFT